jgi:hypothetical protein
MNGRGTSKLTVTNAAKSGFTFGPTKRVIGKNITK